MRGLAAADAARARDHRHMRARGEACQRVLLGAGVLGLLRSPRQEARALLGLPSHRLSGQHRQPR